MLSTVLFASVSALPWFLAVVITVTSAMFLIVLYNILNWEFSKKKIIRNCQKFTCSMCTQLPILTVSSQKVQQFKLISINYCTRLQKKTSTSGQKRKHTTGKSSRTILSFSLLPVYFQSGSKRYVWKFVNIVDLTSRGIVTSSSTVSNDRSTR